MDNKSQMLIYQTPNGNTTIEVKMEGDTLWLTQYQLAELFKTDRTSIVKHFST